MSKKKFIAKKIYGITPNGKVIDADSAYKSGLINLKEWNDAISRRRIAEEAIGIDIDWKISKES